VAKPVWESLDSEKEIKILSRVVVVRPKDKRSVVPVFCPCCSFPMKVVDDFLAYREFECCHHCELKFARTNKERWDLGWRPDQASDTWLEYIQLREVLFKPVFNFS